MNSTAPLAGQRVYDANLTTVPTATAAGTPDWCDTSGKRVDFTSWNTFAQVQFKVEGARASDDIRVEWFTPSGARAASNTPVFAQVANIRCYWNYQPLNYTGAPLGNWSVRVLVNGAPAVNLPFRLNAAPTAPFAVGVKKIPSIVPSGVDMSPLTIHDSGQILYSTNSSAIAPFLGSRANPQTPGSGVTILPGIGPAVYGIDQGSSFLFGTTRIGSAQVGFLRGSATYTYECPGASSTEVRGNYNGPTNPAVGRFADAAGKWRAFRFSNYQARCETLLPPEAITSEANGINALGQVVGSFTDEVGQRRGFLLSGVLYTEISYPSSTSTMPASINTGGAIVGSYLDGAGNERAFVSSKGTYQTLQIPGATMSRATSINGSGQIVGVYRDGNGPLRGFAAYLPEYPLSFCEYSESSTGTDFGPEGGVFELAVNTSAECPWRVSTDSNWILVPAGAQAGAARVTLAATTNTGAARSGNVWVWWTKRAVTQQTGNASSLAISSVSHGASFQRGIPAGGWFVINGTNLAGITRTWLETDFEGTLLPRSLDGLSVKIGGAAAFPYYVSPTQLNVLAPFSVAPGPAVVEVTARNGKSFFLTEVSQISPAFFLAGPARFGLALAAAVHTDGAFVAEPDAIAGARCRPAKGGDLVTLFGTGFGPTNPALADGVAGYTPTELATAVSVTIGGLHAELLYAGLVSPGLVQINVRVPEGIARGRAPVISSVGGVQSLVTAAIAVE